MNNIENGIVTADANATGAVPKSIVTTAGDLIYATGNAAVTRLALGAAGTVLKGGASAPSFATIVNADVDAAAAIARSKLDFGSGLVNTDLATAAAIAVSKLNITGTPDGTKFLRDDGSWQPTSTPPINYSETPTSSAAGQSHGVRLIVGTSNSTRPASGDFVALYTEIDSSAQRNRIWGGNPVAWARSGADAYVWGFEIDVNNDASDVAHPGLTNHKIGCEAVSGNFSYPGSAAFAVNTTRTGGNGWHHGMYIRGVGDSAITVMNDDTAGGNLWPSRGVTIGNPTSAVTGNIVVKQFADNGNGVVVQRFTDTTPSGYAFQVLNAANNAVLAYIWVGGEIRSSVTLGTKHNGASTPTGGLSGDVQVGNGKIWVNDAGTWKSAAVA